MHTVGQPDESCWRPLQSVVGSVLSDLMSDWDENQTGTTQSHRDAERPSEDPVRQ